MTASAGRAERTADFGRSPRPEASRDARWMVGISLAGLLIAAQITLNVQVNGIARDVATLARDVAALAGDVAALTAGLTG